MSSATQHAMSPVLDGKCGTECFNTIEVDLILICQFIKVVGKFYAYLFIIAIMQIAMLCLYIYFSFTLTVCVYEIKK